MLQNLPIMLSGISFFRAYYSQNYAHSSCYSPNVTRFQKINHFVTIHTLNIYSLIKVLHSTNQITVSSVLAFTSETLWNNFNICKCTAMVTRQIAGFCLFYSCMTKWLIFQNLVTNYAYIFTHYNTVIIINLCMWTQF